MCARICSVSHYKKMHSTTRVLPNVPWEKSALIDRGGNARKSIRLSLAECRINRKCNSGWKWFTGKEQSKIDQLFHPKNLLKLLPKLWPFGANGGSSWRGEREETQYEGEEKVNLFLPPPFPLLLFRLIISSFFLSSHLSGKEGGGSVFVLILQHLFHIIPPPPPLRWSSVGLLSITRRQWREEKRRGHLPEMAIRREGEGQQGEGFFSGGWGGILSSRAQFLLKKEMLKNSPVFFRRGVNRNKNVKTNLLFCHHSL